MPQDLNNLKCKIRVRNETAVLNLIGVVEGKLSRIVHHARDYHFNVSLSNFIKNNLHKFWSYISKATKPVSQILTNGILVKNQRGIA